MRLLKQKIFSLTRDLKAKEQTCKSQAKIIALLDNRNKQILRKVQAASKTVRQLDETAFCANQNLLGQVDQLARENEILRKMLQIKNECLGIDQTELKVEEQKINIKEMLKPVKPTDGSFEINPFKGKFKMEKADKDKPAKQDAIQEVFDFAVKQNPRNSKRKRSSSFYFANPDENNEDEDFSKFDYNPTLPSAAVKASKEGKDGDKRRQKQGGENDAS